MQILSGWVHIHQYDQDEFSWWVYYSAMIKLPESTGTLPHHWKSYFNVVLEYKQEMCTQMTTEKSDLNFVFWPSIPKNELYS